MIPLLRLSFRNFYLFLACTTEFAFGIKENGRAWNRRSMEPNLNLGAMVIG